KKKKSDDDDDDDDDNTSGTGVEECDDYLKLYKKCMVDTAPPSAKKAMEESVKTQHDTFKKSASSPAAKSALKTSCESLIESTEKNCKKK
ncbi:MAG: hypothetical protein ABI175_30775, partial [Polyangiales bacterium]